METNIQILLIVVASVGCGCGLGAIWGITRMEREFHSALAFLDGHVDILKERVRKLEQAAHGLKKDGTPRAKPGRKVGF